MIGGFGVRSTTGGMAGVTGRFVGPTQYQQNLTKLKGLETKLTKAKTAVRNQKGLMMRAMFSPAGYKKALAHLHALEKRVTVLSKQVRDLKHLMTVA